MSASHSIRRNDHIEYSMYLVFDHRGGVRLTRGTPGLSRDERAVALVATLATSLFARPMLRATLNVEAGEQVALDIDVQAAEAALRAVVGVDVRLEVVEPEPVHRGPELEQE